MIVRWLAPTLCTLAAAAPAQAAWTPPERLGRPAHFPQLVMAGDGHALLTGSGSRGAQLVSLAPGGMAPVARRRVQDSPAFVTYGRRGTIGFRPNAGVVFGTILDPLARPQRLPGAPILAVRPDGRAAALWHEKRGGRTITRVANRPPGGRFGKPRTVAVGRIDEFLGVQEGAIGEAVAVEADGDVVVALTHAADGGRVREVRALTIRRGMRPGRPQRLGPHGGFAGIRLATAANGRTVIAWRTVEGGQEVNRPTEVWVATRDAGSRRFGRAQRLEANGSAPIASSGYLDLAAAEDGEAVVAWSATARSGHSVVEVASAPPGKRFGRPQALAIDGIEVAAAVAPDGRAVVTWVSSEEPQVGIQVFAALRPAARARFAEAEPVSPPEGAQAPDVAYDPSTGQPLIVWSAAPGARSGFIEGTDRLPKRELSFARFVP
jgi:hypothetical protein